ncbi:MAG: GNAT family N-acetyltransferase [Nitriliruptoraceae bacterium]
MTADPAPIDADAPSERVRIRPMRWEEADRVGELTLAGYDAYGRIEGPYREHLADPRRRVDRCTDLLVAEVAGEVVGTVTFVLPHDGEWEGRRIAEGDASFRMLAVDPRAEGQGVGRALVGACIARAEAHGARRIVITTMAWMDRAQRMYQRLGFQRRPDLDIRFPSGVGYVLTYDLTEDAAAAFPAPGPVPAEPPWYEDVWALERR